jgi:hypothetical protein
MGNESSVSDTNEKYRKLCINYTDKARCLKDVWRFCDELYDKETKTASCNTPCYLEPEGIGFRLVEHETDFNCLPLLDPEFMDKFKEEYTLQNSKDPYGMICKGHDPGPLTDTDSIKYSDCEKDIENILRNCKTCKTKKCKDEIWTYMESAMPLLVTRFKDNVGIENCDQLINLRDDNKCFPNYLEERKDGKLISCTPNFHSNERIFKFCELMGEENEERCMELFDAVAEKCLRGDEEQISLLSGLEIFQILEKTVPRVTCDYVMKQVGRDTMTNEEFDKRNVAIDNLTV